MERLGAPGRWWGGGGGGEREREFQATGPMFKKAYFPYLLSLMRRNRAHRRLQNAKSEKVGRKRGLTGRKEQINLCYDSTGRKSIIGGSSHKYYFCRDKHVFVEANICRDQTFVATKILCRDKHNFVCHDKHTFLATKDLFCRDKHVCAKSCSSPALTERKTKPVSPSHQQIGRA